MFALKKPRTTFIQKKNGDLGYYLPVLIEKRELEGSAVGRVRETKKSDPSVSFWHRTDVRLALIPAGLALVGVLITALVPFFRKDDPAKNPNLVTVNSSTPITLNNNVAVEPHSLPPTKEPDVVLQQFTLNAADSFWELCTGSARECSTGHWSKKITHWIPTDSYERFAGTDVLRTEADERKYNEDRQFYDSHLQPVFDVVVSNPQSHPVVLTGIDVVTLRVADYAVGDGEATPSGGIIKVINRYTFPIDNPYENVPRVRSYPATPPLEITPNRPARFQIAFANKVGAMLNWEMRVRFHFGQGGTVQTERFRIRF